jgi:Tol biopolymer transport system component
MVVLLGLAANRSAYAAPSGRILVTQGDGIYAMNPDGTRLTQVLRDGYDGAWSPDGNRIVYLRDASLVDEKSNEVGLYVVKADGSDLRKLTGNPNHYAPSWSPDGQKIAFMADVFVDDERGYATRLMTIDADGGRWRAVVDDIGYSRPAWSPDSRRMAFVKYEPRQVSDGNGGTYTTYDSYLYVVNADGSGLRRVTDLPGVSDPAWSSAGIIAFTYYGDYEKNVSPGLFTINPDGSSLKRLTSNNAYTPSWSPDARQLVAIGDDAQGNWGVLILNADGSGQRMYLSGRDVWTADWGVSGSVTPRGNVPPYVVGTRYDARTQAFAVTFSQDMTDRTAENPSNFILESPLGTRMDLSSKTFAYDPTSTTVYIAPVDLAQGQYDNVEARVTVVGARSWTGVPVPNDGFSNVSEFYDSVVIIRDGFLGPPEIIAVDAKPILGGIEGGSGGGNLRTTTTTRAKVGGVGGVGSRKGKVGKVGKGKGKKGGKKGGKRR